MKRLMAVLVGTGLAVGGGVAAWAGPGGGDGGAKREAVKACMAQAREAQPGATKAELMQAVRSCLEAQGITRPAPTPEQQAKRQALKSCLADVKKDNPDATKEQLKELAKPCLEQAGVTPGQIRPKLRAARQCLRQAKAQSSDADKAALRDAVKACMSSQAPAS